MSFLREHYQLPNGRTMPRAMRELVHAPESIPESWPSLQIASPKHDQVMTWDEYEDYCEEEENDALAAMQGPWQPAPGPSFLGLPPELRIAIYELVFKDCEIQILRSFQRPMACPHPLKAVSSQISREARACYYRTCPVESVVTDFDFSHILEWEARRRVCSDMKELRRNPNLTIKLSTYSWPGDRDDGRMARWLDRHGEDRPSILSWSYTSRQSSQTSKDYFFDHQYFRKAAYPVGIWLTSVRHALLSTSILDTNMKLRCEAKVQEDKKKDVDALLDAFGLLHTP